MCVSTGAPRVTHLFLPYHSDIGGKKGESRMEITERCSLNPPLFAW